MGGESISGTARLNATATYNLNDGTSARTMTSTPGPVNNQNVWRYADSWGWITEYGAKLNYAASKPLVRQLIEHYRWGNGVELCILEPAMKQCNAVIDFGNDQRSPTFLKFISQMGAEIAQRSGGDPAKLKNVLESTISFDMIAGCNTSGTLGNFTVNASGTLKVWSPNADGTDADWSFEGNMWWYDRWDFDHRPAAGKGEAGRTATGSWRTDVGAMMSGIPFDIKSASVPVRQVRGEATKTAHWAKWSGNPDGSYPPVESGFL